MKGLLIGDWHTWGDLKLVMSEREISAPEPKTHFVEIEGANGSLDFSEYFGEVLYNRRKIKYTFTSTGARKDFVTEFTKIQNLFHGKEYNFIEDEDPMYFYRGRITIDKWKVDKVIGSFEMEIDCDPYKYKVNETIRTEHVTGTMYFAFWNDRMSVTPVFNVSAPMTIVFNGKTVSIGTVDTDITSVDIVFREGNNTIQVTGEGLITVKYQEGSL